MAQTYSNDYYEPVGDCYHCYTDGNCADVMFPDNDAKVYGMNIIPALLLKAGVILIAFVLMDNHVHFCLRGKEDECVRFMKLYVFAVSNYLTKRFNGEYKSVSYKWSVLCVSTKGQLMKTIAYIFRNPLMAGFGRMPSEYPWSNAADCFMNIQNFAYGEVIVTDDPVSSGKVAGQRSSGHNVCGCRTIGSLSPSQRRAILKVCHSYPDEWIVDGNGVIRTAHYSGRDFIERQVFGSVRRYLYYLSLRCEDEVNDAIFKNRGTFLSDAEVRSLAKSLSQEKFGRQDVRCLPLEQKIRLVRDLRKRIGCSNTQLSRVIGSPVKDWLGFV